MNIYRQECVKRFFDRFINCCKSKYVEHARLAPGPSVLKERQITENVILTNTMGQHAIVMHNLGRSYGKLHAVRQVNLTINKG